MLNFMAKEQQQTEFNPKRITACSILWQKKKLTEFNPERIITS
jgi:hypothetical protein